MAHIAFFLPSLRGGGAERIMVTLANGFASKGHKVDLVLATTEGPYLSEISENVRVISFDKSRILACLFPLVRYLRREKPDSMLSAMNHANIIAIWARKIARSNTRLAVSEHNSPSQSLAGSGMKRIMRALIRRFYASADSIVCVSHGIRREMHALFNLPNHKLVTVYNPLNIDRIQKLMVANVEHPWITKKDKPVILAVGRLTIQKDYPTLLKAFSKLLSGMPARLVLLGEGNERGTLEKLAKDLGIEEDMFFGGFQSNPFAWMYHSDLYAMSSAWEGLPGVLLEALVCGPRIVSTACPTGPDEILENGKWGALVPVGDVDGFAAAMQKALTEPPPSRSDVMAHVNNFRPENIINEYSKILVG